MTAATLKIKNSKRLLSVILFIALAIYWPSMSGPFLFDDLYNLNSLGINGGIDSLDAWFDFVLSGGGNYLGRPLSLATFTLNAQTWPADPFSFKITNLLIHFFNAWLMFIFLYKITLLYNKDHNTNLSNFIPLVGTVIWLLHPIHITSVLQIVQRMTLLGGTFTLLSLIIYTNYVNNHKLKLNASLSVLIALLSIMGILGVLSKETAIATPLFVFALNYTVFRKRLSYTPRFTIIWQSLLLVGPLLIFFVGSIYIGGVWDGQWLNRDFDLTQRVLTETRILFQYLSSIFLPQASGSGMFHDDIVISTSLVQPLSTVLSIFGIIFLIASAIKLRISKPFVSLAILWFFLGHVFESTILPLELYFEHRNYLPSLCLIFILFQLGIELHNKTKKTFIYLSSSYLLLISFITAITTPIWGDSLRLFTTWAEENPTSVRAQHAAAMTWLHNYNDPASARTFLLQALKVAPMDLGTRMRLIESYCFFENSNEDISLLIDGLENTKPDGVYLIAISNIISRKESGQCSSLSTNLVTNGLTRLENNPRIMATVGGWLFYHKARILFVAGKNMEALEYAEKSSQKTSYLGTKILKVKISISMGSFDLAKRYMSEAVLLEKEQLKLLAPQVQKSYEDLKIIVNR